MHRFFFATKVAFINSCSDQITRENWLDKNTGQDEILELKKVFWNRDFHYQTRALIQFDSDEIENFIKKDPSINLIIHGHTHIYRNENIGNIKIINPGECAGIMKGKNAVGLLKLKDLSFERIFF